MAGHRRAGATALLTVILATGCVDSGLPGKNLPLEEARHREWRYPLYQAAVQPSGLPDLIHFDGSTWALQSHGWPEMGIATTLTRDPSMLEVVSGGSAAFQALRWDEAPYDRLFLRAPSGLREYERVY
jgi:hypothetical protein